MISIFGEKMEKKNNEERSAGIPDERGQRKKQHHWIRLLLK
jgi:hypothetical protein